MGDLGGKRVSRRVLIGAGGAAAAAGLAVSAFRSSDTRRIPAIYDGHTLNRGNGAEPDTLDPHLATTLYEDNIIGDMFVGLLTEDAHGNPVPGAAVDFEASADGLSYTFKLREHLWSDGTPVTAHDFVFSYRRMLDPKTAAQYGAMLYPIVNAQAVAGRKRPAEDLGVFALDDRTLRIDFAVEVPYAQQLFMYFPTFAVPRHIVERHGERWLSAQNAVSNGAYLLKEWIPNDHILLVKNPRFYDAKNVAIERLYYYPTQDYSAALKRFRTGEIDVQSGIPSEELSWLKYNMPGVLRSNPYMAIRYITFNMGAAPFGDWRVRTALSLAINREVMANRVMRGGERPAYAFVPPHMPGYPGRAQLRFREMPMAARAEKAKALLAAAGFGPNNPLSFDYNVYDTSDARLAAVALQAMWKAVGAEVNIVPSDKKNHYNLLYNKTFAVACAGYVADYCDAKDFLFLLSSVTPDMNYGNYYNPKYDALLVSSDRERDPAKRARLLEEGEQIMLDDAPIAPLYNDMSHNLVSPPVIGWYGNDIDIHRSRYLRLDRSRTVV